MSAETLESEIREQPANSVAVVEKQALDAQMDERLAQRMCSKTYHNQPEIWRQAFGEWYRRHGVVKVKRFLAYKLGMSDQDNWIDDLADAAVCIAYEAVMNGKFTYRERTFSAYVKAIAYNWYRYQARHLSREVYMADLEENGYEFKDETTDLEQVEAEIMASKIFKRVSKKEADLLRRRFYEQQPYRQIAKDKGVKEHTLHQRIRRLVKEMPQRLKLPERKDT